MLPAVSPPSTGSTVPVIQAASSEARNRAALATSSGSPTRPSGYHLVMRSKTSGSASLRCSQAGVHGADVENNPCPFLYHAGQHDLRAQKRALQRDAHVFIPGLCAEAEEVFVGSLCRVVDQYIHRSERLAGRLDHGSYVGRVGYVRRSSQGVATRIENLLRDRGRASPRFVSDHDGSALLSETVRQYPTQSRAAPGYDGNPILETHL